MKRCFLIIVALMLTGCTKGMIAVDNVDGLFHRVADRHDAYIAADRTLAPVEKQIANRDTQLLREVIAEAKK